MRPGLRPTLWRTCRVLANVRRLRVLAFVTGKREVCVKAVATACGLSQPQATQHLRLLQSRGLLRIRRAGRWAYYRTEADPLVEQAAPLLSVMTRALQRRIEPDDIVCALTAYTHARRVRIVCALAAGPLHFDALSARCGVPWPALSRHLRKLERRRVVARMPDDRFRLAPRIRGLRADLLRLATDALP